MFLKTKNRILLFILSLFVFSCIIYNYFNRSFETIDFSKYNKSETTETVGEIVDGTSIIQEFTRMYNEINYIQLQFATYYNRLNQGIVNIKIYELDTLIGDFNYDVSTIKDGDFIKIPVVNNEGKIGNKIKIIISGNSQSGKAVTLWMSQNEQINKVSGKLIINDLETNKQLHFNIIYKSLKANNLLVIEFLVFLWILVPLGLFDKFYRQYKNNIIIRNKVNELLKCLLLLLIGFALLTLRNWSYITNPTLYGEDAKYLSNLINYGLTNSIFLTRSGNIADFQNSGSYIILYIALKTTELFYGYNISYLPVFIGIYSNLFWALVAFSAYKLFDKRNRILGILIFSITIMIPVGNSGGEIFGRVLNTVFIWPYFVSVLLLQQYNQRYNLGLRGIFIGIICIIGGFSFPVSYGAVGIYLIFAFIRALKEKKLKSWFLTDILQIICIAIGIFFLPTIIHSKGAAVEYATKSSSIIEFILARHVLYPFIQSVYVFMSNWLVLLLFMVFCVVIIYALIIVFRNKLLFNDYFLLVCITTFLTISSAIMRIQMTELFDNYKSSFPDRYYYGCNLLCTVTFFYAMYIILSYHKISDVFKQIIFSLLIMIIIINPFLFEYGQENFNIYGSENLGDFKSCVSYSLESNSKVENGRIKVMAYPIGGNNNWSLYLPLEYAYSTVLIE